MLEIYTGSFDGLKAVVTVRSLNMDYFDRGNEYYVYAIEDDIKTYFYNITKDSPANGEQTDFETNYKPSIDSSPPVLVPRDEFGKPVQRTESRPIGATTCFVGQGDNVDGYPTPEIGGGKVLSYDFSNNDDIVDAPAGFKRKRLEFQFIDSIWVKEGTIYFFDAVKGSYIDFYVVCPSGQYYYDNNGVPHLATEDTPVNHYVIHHPLQGSVPMGDELNTETCSVEIPPNYKFWVEVTVPDSDTLSSGNISIEMYRKRTIIL